MEPQQEVVAGEAGQLEGAQADLIALGHLAPLAGAEVGEDYMQQGGDQMPPQEPIQLQGPWERKKISDLRAFLLTKNLDTALLDSVLVMAGDPVTRINRAPKGEGRKRAAPTEGADGSDGNVEKRRRMPAAPDPNIPPEVQAMSVTELRVRSRPATVRAAAMQPKAFLFNRTLRAPTLSAAPDGCADTLQGLLPQRGAGPPPSRSAAWPFPRISAWPTDLPLRRLART